VIRTINIHPTGQAFDYTVTLEPHHKQWLFALDLPTSGVVAEILIND